MGTQLVQDGPGTPEEDPRVPEEAAGGQELLGRGAVGLFAELDDAIDRDAFATLQERSALDVAVAGLGAIGGDAEGHQRAGIVIDDRDRGPYRRPECLDGLDDVVGRHHDHGPIPILARDDARGQPHAWGRVAWAGLGDDVGGRQVGELGPRRLGLVRPGDDHDAVGGHQVLDPRHGLLEHRRLARQTQQLFGPVAAALGPEPGAAAARHDDRV